MRKFLATILFSSLAFVDIHATTTTLSSGTLTQNITLGSGDIVNFNGGSLSGTITSSSNNSGTVNINQNYTALGAMGSSSSYLDTINVANDTTFNSGANRIFSDDIILGNGSTFEVSGQNDIYGNYVNSDIIGISDDVGTINFADNYSHYLEGDLGSPTIRLNKMILKGHLNVNYSSSIYVNQILLNGAVNIFSVRGNESDGLPITKGIIDFTSIDANTGVIAFVSFNGSRTLTADQSLGQTGRLQSVEVSSGTLSSSANIATHEISVTNNTTFDQIAGTVGDSSLSMVLSGSNATYRYSGGTFTGRISGTGIFEVNADFTNSGVVGIGSPLTINVSANKTLTSGNTIYASNINLASGAKFKYSSGTITGTLRGTSNGVGIFEVDANYNGNLRIGSSGSALASVLINSGKTLTLNGDVYAIDTTVNGTLNFGSSARRINGNLTSAASKTLVLGGHTNTVVGDVTVGANNTINTEISDTNNIGGITATGTQTIGASPTINITLDTGAHIANGSTFTLFSGASGSSFSSINDSVLNVNSSGTNQIDRFTLNTSQVGSSVILTINSIVTPIVVTKPVAVNSYNLLSSIGGDAVNGNLRIFKGYLENNSVSTADKEAALTKAAPQVDNSTNISALNNAKAGMRVIETRLESVRGLASGDEMKNLGMWFKTFGSSINQGDIGADDGYKARSSGFGFGLDKEFTENTILGFSLNFANANIKSNLDTKKTSVETYQLNLYGSYNYEKYFVDSIAGFAWNRYNSIRTVPVVLADARANFDGQTYVAKIRGGVEEKLGNGFAVIPGIGLTYAHNTVDQYTEEGAETMNLRVKNGSFNFLEARGAIKLKYEKKLESGTRISPDIRVSYGHDFFGQRQSTNSNFTGHVGTFSSRGAKVYKNSIIVGAGLNIFRTDSIAIETNYNYEHKKEYNAHGADVKVRYDF